MMEPTILLTIHAGAGGRGAALLRAMIESGLFEPAAVVGAPGGEREAAREAAGLPETACFEQLADALAGADADAVVVAAPVAGRPDLIIEALANDRHVLAEAPLAGTLEEARRCVFIAQNRGVKLMAVPPPAAETSVEETVRRFHAWVLGGEEPATSGRRSLAALEAAADERESG
jgi:hypothetical protein